MQNIEVNQLINAPITAVWEALTVKDVMKKWYFDIPDFKLEVGAVFNFYEDETNKKFHHQCTVLEIIPNEKFVHTWTYPAFSDGVSEVSWILKPISENETQVQLIHTGIENFLSAGPEFQIANFEMGWTAFVKTILRNFLNGIEKLTFIVEINAKAATVWNKLWNSESYKIWTGAFCEGSYYEGELQQGNRVHLLTPSGEGMYSDVFFVKENEKFVFQHNGNIKDFAEQPIDEATSKWTGCFEAYTLTEKDGKTELKVEVDTVNEYIDFMKTTFPKALEKLKILCEE
jgi:uncharacterized protein YndB with AHSA1/START domain